MKNEGLLKNYGNIKLVNDKPFYPHQNFIKGIYDTRLNPILAPLNIQNLKLWKEMEQNNIWKDLFEKQPDAIIGMGNWFYMEKLFQQTHRNLFSNLKNRKIRGSWTSKTCDFVFQ